MRSEWSLARWTTRRIVTLAECTLKLSKSPRKRPILCLHGVGRLLSTYIHYSLRQESSEICRTKTSLCCLCALAKSGSVFTIARCSFISLTVNCIHLHSGLLLTWEFSPYVLHKKMLICSLLHFQKNNFTTSSRFFGVFLVAKSALKHRGVIVSETVVFLHWKIIIKIGKSSSLWL